MTFSTLLMDADDTIFDFPKCEYNALRETVTLHGLTFTDQTHTIFSQINNSLWKKFEINQITRSELKIQRFRQLAQACFRDFPNPDILADTYINELAKQPVLIEGAFEALQKITQKFDVYIITNGLSKVQRGRFGKSPITPLVKDIFISDEMGVNKPSKEYFDKVLAQIPEKDTSKILVVGDSLTSDMQGGKNAGLMTCIYDPKNKITLPHPLCDFKITNLNDILQFAE